MKKSSELDRDIEQWFYSHKEEYFRDLNRLVSIQSYAGAEEPGFPYGRGPAAALEAAAEMLKNAGFTVDSFENRVITADLGGLPPRLGILAHLDTVGVGEGWDTYPFELTEKDGRVYGRGVSDDKGPALAAVYAMRCVSELGTELKAGCRIILGSAEETGCFDIARYMEKNELPEFVFSPDSDYPVVNIEKGRIVPEFGASWQAECAAPCIISITGGNTVNIVPNLATAVLEGIGLASVESHCRRFSAITDAEFSARWVGERVEITCAGKSSHAAHPRDGENAQTALISLLASMPLRGGGYDACRALAGLFPHGDVTGRALGVEMRDDESGELTVNFGVLSMDEGGFTANFDSRTPVCADDCELPNKLRAALENAGFTVSDISVAKSHHTPASSPLVRALLGVYESYTGNEGKCLSVGGSTYVHSIEGGVAFGCVMPGKDTKMHGANEFMDADDLIMSARMFARAIVELCG